jgi:large subunit ribosomal protein L7/L12
MPCPHCATAVNVGDRYCGDCGHPLAQTASEWTGEFEVILLSAGMNKIQVIKVVRELTGLGLRDAKDLVEGAPNRVLQGLSKAGAESLKRRLEECGATVQLLSVTDT